MSTLIGLAHEPIFNAVWASVASFQTKSGALPTWWPLPYPSASAAYSAYPYGCPLDAWICVQYYWCRQNAQARESCIGSQSILRIFLYQWVT